MAFQTVALQKHGADYAPVSPRYHTPYFSHIVGGYAAGYYAYIWSEALARDAEQWFHKYGGLQRADGEFLRAKVLSRGRTAILGNEGTRDRAIALAKIVAGHR